MQGLNKIANSQDQLSIFLGVHFPKYSLNIYRPNEEVRDSQGFHCPPIKLINIQFYDILHKPLALAVT